MSRYVCYADGASRGNPGPASFGVYIKDTKTNKDYKLSIYLGDNLTNNYAEYYAIVACLKKLKKLKAESIEINMDSLLVVQQLNGKYKVNSANIKNLYTEANTLMKEFKDITIQHILRNKNTIADALANKALDEK